MAEQKRIGHRRMDDSGNVTFKKIQTTQIMGSIQLGITTAISSLASKPERDLLMKDFMEVETVPFTKAGSQQTPAHHYNDFKFKTYAPIAFRHFRALFCIKTDDFLISVCNAPLRELTNPGASGSVFYLTHDDDFIIKTVQHKEAEFLLKLLPGYYMNLRQNPRTLLPKFFGQYCYICGGKNVRLIIMNNLLPSTIKMHQKYDLKGSTYKRKASSYERSKPSPTFKDLDFMEHHTEGLILEPDTYNALMKTIQTDLRVLESFKIMDFSLLVGVHNLDQAKRDDANTDQVEMSDGYDEMKPVRDKSIDTNNPGEGTSVGGGSANKNQTYRPGLSALHSSVGMDSMNQSDIVGSIPARNSKGENLLLFMGIIDILQSYRFTKKLEHTFKSMIHDGDSISVHKPSYYSQRFHEFMATKVFKSSSNSPTKRRRTVQTDL